MYIFFDCFSASHVFVSSNKLYVLNIIFIDSEITHERLHVYTFVLLIIFSFMITMTKRLMLLSNQRICCYKQGCHKRNWSCILSKIKSILFLFHTLDYAEDAAVLGEMFLTLSKLAVRNEFCQEIMDLGGLQLMLDALEKSITKKVVIALNTTKFI